MLNIVSEAVLLSETSKAAATCKPGLDPIKNSSLQPTAEETCHRAYKKHEIYHLFL